MRLNRWESFLIPLVPTQSNNSIRNEKLHFVLSHSFWFCVCVRIRISMYLYMNRHHHSNSTSYVVCHSISKNISLMMTIWLVRCICQRNVWISNNFGWFVAVISNWWAVKKVNFGITHAWFDCCAMNGSWPTIRRVSRVQLQFTRCNYYCTVISANNDTINWCSMLNHNNNYVSRVGASIPLCDDLMMST